MAENIYTLKNYQEAQEEALSYIYARQQGTVKSLKTPWKKYNDAHLDGQEFRKIVTIAGMSGSGKSIIAEQLESNLHLLNQDEDFIVLSFNFEMPARQIAIRNIISRTGLSSKEILSSGGQKLSAEHFEMIKKLVEENSFNTKIFYMEYPKTVAEYKAMCISVYNNHKLPLVIITDHSALFKRGSLENSTTDTLYSLGDASVELKKLIPCIQFHVSQLNREIEKAERRLPAHPLNIPDKSCIFGADALYQCADTVLVNHRPYLLNFRPNTFGPNKLPCGVDDLYWIFLKLRDGDPFNATMTADFKHMKIYDR